MVSEGSVMSPKEIVAFYATVAKDCYVSTGSKRVACVAAAITCGVISVPGQHQGHFIVACGTAVKGVNKIK
jgi:hypothetical protein